MNFTEDTLGTEAFRAPERPICAAHEPVAPVPFALAIWVSIPEKERLRRRNT